MQNTRLSKAPLTQDLNDSTWSRWFAKLIDLWNAENWIAPILTNGWANVGGIYEPAGYYKDGWGIVHIRGFIINGTAGVAAFTLPVGYRPQYNQVVMPYANVGAVQVLAYIDIDTTGTIRPSIGGAGNHCAINTTFKAYQ